MMGPGKYDEQLAKALAEIGAQSGILIVMDGSEGPSFCAKLPYHIGLKLPEILRFMADDIEQEIKRDLANAGITP